MSRKSVLTTIRPNFFYLNLSNFNSNFYVLGTNFLKSFDELMLKKGIFQTNSFINFSGATLTFKSSLFLTTNFLKILKKKHTKVLKNKKFYEKYGFFNILKSLINKLRITHLLTHFKIINKTIDKKYTFFLFKKLKKYVFKIFSRRFNLFLDFIKVTSLYGKNLIDLKLYISIIATIFKNLRKRTHITFYGFLKKTLNILVYDSKKYIKKENKILGVKILIKGRLLGKSRASQYAIQVGSVPIQTISSQIKYAQATSFTHDCGTFGFEVWSNR
jgi:hypothetical protein